MVNIVFCGPDDDRNVAVVTELRRQCSKSLKNHRDILYARKRTLTSAGINNREQFRCDATLYEQVLADILSRQCSEENKDSSTDFITDNCVINTLALANVCLDQSAVDRLRSSNDEIGKSLQRYRSSLVILLRPDRDDFDDNIWLKLSHNDWANIVLPTYKSLLIAFRIPFLDLSSADLTGIVSTTKDAIAGSIQLETSNLLHYEMVAKDEKGSGNRNVQPVHSQKSFIFFQKTPDNADDISIPTIKVLEHKYEQEWTSYPEEKTSRFIKRYGRENIVLVSFHIHVRSSNVQKTLLNGIMVNGELYSFLGCSSSGLKDRKCFMWKGTSEDVKRVLQSNGDFDAIKSVSKRLSRIGLLFSAVTNTTVRIEDSDLIMIDDIESDGHNFSDGCGLVGEQVARELYKQVQGDQQGDGYIASVYQVRFQGYKGVLALDKDIGKDKIAVRPSMKKFHTDHYPYIGVCSHSKKYTFGHLNKQFIQLLSGLGVPDKSFLQKQDQHFSMIQTMLSHSDSAVRCLQWRNQHELAQRIVKAGGLDKMQDEERRETSRSLKKLQQMLVSKIQKLSILVLQSRNLFGICDISATLDYGECFLRVTLDGKPKTIRGQVVVCKNPCYLLGDVRVLTAVDDTDKPDLTKLHHLTDCIVFPSIGKRPHADEIAGSDLDGDEYFVTWDETLIPTSQERPYDYPSAKSKPQGDVTDERTIAYFSKQNETKKMIARVNKLYNQWADLKHVTSEECELLGQLFSRVIDSGKSGEEIDIPKSLQPPPQKNQFVWTAMEKNAAEFEERFKKEVTRSGTVEDVTPEFVEDLVEKSYTNISEYEKFLFCWKYSLNFHDTQEESVEFVMENYASKINFSDMTIVERKDVLEKGLPRKYVLNALNKSTILTEEDLRHFQMDSPLNTWGEYLALDNELFDWSHLFKSLTTNDCNLLVLEMPDDVILELQILDKLKHGTEQIVPAGIISALFYSKHFGYKYRYILGAEYVLDLTLDTFQLYRDGKKNLTFVWLKATDRKATKGRWNKRVADEVVNSLSVDLQRFDRNILSGGKRHPLVNKTPFVRMELYAQNYNSTDYPYWDTYDANDILPIEVDQKPETDMADDYRADFEKLFPDEMPDITINTEDSFIIALGEAIDNPYTFKAVLDQGKDIDMHETKEEQFDKLLTHMVKVISPEKLPDQLQSLMTTILAMVSDNIVDPQYILSTASNLQRLGLADVGNQLVQKSLETCSIETFLSTIENWQSLYFMETQSVRLFLQQLSVSVITRLTNDTVTENAQRKAYLHQLGFLHVLALVEEIDQQKQQMTKQATTGPSSKDSQTAIQFLKVVTTEEQEGDAVSFYRTCALEHSLRITQGQHVCIQRQSSTDTPLMIGQVHFLRLAPFYMTLKCESVPESILSSMRKEGVRYFRAELIGNIVTYHRVISAMKKLDETDHAGPLLGFISRSIDSTGQEDTDTDTVVEDVPCANLPEDSALQDLNTNQKEAVTRSLQNRLCLIQGPPGTGKTTVACRIVREIVSSAKYVGVLVVAETNVAVDNLARRLRNDLQVVRIGSAEGTADDLYGITLEEQVRKIADKEAKRSVIRDQQGELHRNTRLIKRVLSASDVVLATCAGCGDAVLDSGQFDFVLVDEATLTMETTLLCALARGVKHMVLIGDHKQLGPVVPDSKSTASTTLDLPSPSNLMKTLFHRLIDIPSVPSCFLAIQHRMHPELMKFPSDEFYDGELVAGECVKRRLEIKFPWPQVKPYKPICFVNVDYRESRRGTSYCNNGEVEVVRKVVDTLLRVNEEDMREYRIGVNQIAVLTLYQSQVVELKRKIQKGVAVSSVDGFQGQEKDVIVVSTVRSNVRRAVGFSGDPQRINVLLTRAKRGLIVVGNAETLKASEIWSRWLLQAPVLAEKDIQQIDTRPAKKEMTADETMATDRKAQPTRRRGNQGYRGRR